MAGSTGGATDCGGGSGASGPGRSVMGPGAEPDPDRSASDGPRPAEGGAGASGGGGVACQMNDEHITQNWTPSGFSLPHASQTSIRHLFGEYRNAESTSAAAALAVAKEPPTTAYQDGRQRVSLLAAFRP